MPFQFQRLEIPDIILVQARAARDKRGYFMETYKQSVFASNGLPDVFVQDNHSHSMRGVLRGLHYQKHPKAQGKLVMVLRGEIFDVAVDIRRGSPTFGTWIGRVLSSENWHMLYIPIGFAHGFCVLSDEADVVYKVTDEYAPECERGIVWNDPEIGIQWPVAQPIVSTKDAVLPLLKDADFNFEFRA
jgi:dTDP-4-dehydrorhamnose 3,5-epimerase